MGGCRGLGRGRFILGRKLHPSPWWYFFCLPWNVKARSNRFCGLLNSGVQFTYKWRPGASEEKRCWGHCPWRTEPLGKSRRRAPQEKRTEEAPEAALVCLRRVPLAKVQVARNWGPSCVCDFQDSSLPWEAWMIVLKLTGTRNLRHAGPNTDRCILSDHLALKLTLPPFYKWGNWGSERWSSVPQAALAAWEMQPPKWLVTEAAPSLVPSSPASPLPVTPMSLHPAQPQLAQSLPTKLWIYQISKLEKRCGFHLTHIELLGKKKKSFQKPSLGRGVF